ncbi:hypothetical protein AURDEDRAFT_111204 [Auricularia subglabra TFB-10046 SS5]|nr:hypothetical protein AURDEDRAFT_111204 [Auricularia subglabra TFB-10046 SS5]
MQRYADYTADPGPAAPLQLDILDFGPPEEVMADRVFVPSRAATPEPHSPRSRPVELRSPPIRASPQLYEPYPTSSAAPARRRNRAPGNKRSMNAFLIYRRDFPRRYPHIDDLEKHQGPKSSIIGAMWRAEPLEVKEHYFHLQADADAEFRKAHGTEDAPRADPMKTLMRRERARQTRPRDEKLAPRSELIVKLWREKKTVEEFKRAVHEYDEQCQNAEKTECSKVKTSGNASPLSNHTNTPMAEEVTAPCPSTPILQIQTTVPNFFPVTPGLTEPACSPVTSPVLNTPPDSPIPSPAIALPDQEVSSGFSAEMSVGLTYKPDASGLAELYNFNALLELALADPPRDVQPAVCDDMIAQYIRPDALACPPQLSDLGVNLDELLASSGISDQFFLDPAVGLDQGFAFGNFDGSFPLGTEDDLLGLSPYNNDNLMEPVDNLVDCYVQMNCLPP